MTLSEIFARNRARLEGRPYQSWQEVWNTPVDPQWQAAKPQMMEQLRNSEAYKKTEAIVGGDLMAHHMTILEQSPNRQAYEAHANEWARQHPGKPLGPMIGFTLGALGVGAAAAGASGAGAATATEGAAVGGTAAATEGAATGTVANAGGMIGTEAALANAGGTVVPTAGGAAGPAVAGGSGAVGGAASAFGGSELVRTLGGSVLPAVLGAYASNKQSQSLEDLANQYMAMGAPSRGRYEASFAPGFSMAKDPGYTDALDQTTKSFLHKASIGGNPADSPNAWQQTLKDVNATFAYPALQDYRKLNANTGGLSRFAEVAPAAATGAIGAQRGVYDALGYGAANIFNPPSTLEQIMRAYRGAV